MRPHVWSEKTTALTILGSYAASCVLLAATIIGLTITLTNTL